MTSSPNVSPAKGVSKTDDRRVIGGHATKAERYLVDLACAKLDLPRARFVVAAAVEKAQRVLDDAA